MALLEFLGNRGPATGKNVRICSPHPGQQLQPRVITFDGTNAQDIWDAGGAYTETPSSPDRLPVKVLRIQNQSTAVVYVCKDGTASAVNYHYALQACSVAKDGKGGLIDLSVDQPGRVSVFSATAGAIVRADIVYENSL